MEFNFIKMQGCGNTFLFLDYTHSEPPSFYPREIQYLCDRNFGVGADGLAILHRTSTPGVHAAWKFYNSDGSEAAMCGNAARCAIRLLSERHFPNDVPLVLETKAGLIKGKCLDEPNQIEITLLSKSIQRFEYEQKLIATDKYSVEAYLTNTGVPHAVVEVKDIYSYPICEVGRDLVRHPVFGLEGSNITFFQRMVGNHIRSTTFERGVEEETMACGTGAAAAAIIYSELYLQPLPIEVSVPGGTLTVLVSPASKMLLLQGPAEFIFEVKQEGLPNHFEKQTPYSAKRR